MQRKESSMPYLTGAALTTLMRRHSVTIRALATRMQIPMVRVRYCREYGVVEANSARDWIEAITGTDPGALFAAKDKRRWQHNYRLKWRVVWPRSVFKEAFFSLTMYVIS